MIASLRTLSQFTTGQVARICGVAPRTVSKWFDSGRLEDGWCIPGSGDRRIPRNALLRFILDYNLPLGALHGFDSVMIFGFPSIAVPLAEKLKEAGLKIFLPANTYEAGVMFAERHPVAAIVDCRKNGARTVIRSIRAIDSNERVITVCFAGRNTMGIRGCDDWFYFPVDPALIATRLCTLLRWSTAPT